MVTSVVSVTLALVPAVYGSDAYEQALLKAIEREYQEMDRQNDRMDQANRDYHNSARQIQEDRLARERLSTIKHCFFLVFFLVCIAMYIRHGNTATAKDQKKLLQRDESETLQVPN